MAQIPRFDGRIGQSLDPNATDISGNVYVAPARLSPLEGAGQGIQQLAQAAGAIFQAEGERKAANYVTDTSAKLQEQTSTMLRQRQQKAMADGNVDGFAQGFMNDYDKVVADAINKAPNPYAVDAMKGRLSQARMSMLGQVAKFEADTKIDLYKLNLEKAADAYSRTAAINPTQIPQLMRQLDGDLAAAKETLGLVDTERLSMAYKNQILATSISATIDGNPGRAKEMLNTYRDNLDPKTMLALENNIKTEQRRLEAAANALAKKKAKEAEVWGAVNGGIPLDPTNKNHRKAVDQYYNMMKQQDPNYTGVGLAVGTGIMPPAMQTQIVGSLANGNPEQKAAAARTVKLLQTGNPIVADKLPAKYKARAQIINDYLDTNMDPMKAVEWADKETNEADEKVIKFRAKAYNKISSDTLNFDSIQGQFTSLFGASKESIPDEMKVEYNMLTRGYYVDEGLNEEQAGKAALQDLKARWSVSKVGGRKRYMRDAPELIYGIRGVDSEWIQGQLKSDIAQHVLSSPESLDKTMKNVFLEVNPYLDNTDSKVYNVCIKNDKGVCDVLYRADDKREPFLFKPEFKKSEAYRKMLSKYPGQNDDERFENFLKEAAEQKALFEKLGLGPDFKGTIGEALSNEGSRWKTGYADQIVQNPGIMPVDLFDEDGEEK